MPLNKNLTKAEIIDILSKMDGWQYRKCLNKPYENMLSNVSSTQPNVLSTEQAYLYLASNRDLLSVLGSNIELAKKHYIEFGKYEGRSIDSFNVEQYKKNYNLVMSDIEAIKDFVNSGWSLGRTDQS